MSFKDNVRKKAEDIDLEGMARQLQAAAAKAAKQAREKAGDFATENREKIDGYVEQAGAKFDEKTHAKYADTVAKVKQQVHKGVDKIAEGGHVGTGGAADASFPVDPGAPEANDASGPFDESGFNAAAGDLPVPAQEALHDTTLEDTTLGHDLPPETPTLSDPPVPEDAGPHPDRDATR